MPDDDEIRITEGGRELRAFLNRNSLSVPVFCTRHSLDRIQVQRVLKGERWKRISVDFAFSIQRATGGHVRADSFRSSTAKAPARRAA